MKTAKTTKTAKTVKTTKNAQEVRESINWNAKYYREKAMKFYESASYEAASKPVVMKTTKKEVKAVLSAASKVRHNKPSMPVVQPKKFVMVGGVPHKIKDGKLVPLTAVSAE